LPPQPLQKKFEVKKMKTEIDEKEIEKYKENVEKQRKYSWISRKNMLF